MADVANGDSSPNLQRARQCCTHLPLERERGGGGDGVSWRDNEGVRETSRLTCSALHRPRRHINRSLGAVIFR